MNDSKALQSFECEVLSVDEDGIFIAMHDLSNEANPVEFAVVKEKVIPAPLREVGVIFYWTIEAGSDISTFTPHWMKLSMPASGDGVP